MENYPYIIPFTPSYLEHRKVKPIGISWFCDQQAVLRVTGEK